MITLDFRPAADDPHDLATLVGLYDGAARWMQENGIDQWKPGEKSEDHFRLRIKEGEVWLASADGEPAGAYELWWEDEPAWGPQPPVAGYVHRLMTGRSTPAGTGRALLAHAEQRVAAQGRGLCRLDCVSSNPRLRAYYEHAGYTVVGEQPFKEGAGGSKYGVTLLEKRLAPELP
ncbi:GNAT family N-acetyltransferase [Streptomyces indicus]|uniref:Acetyltransferase (GNAT) domain-containing protein n=1 Tax=Streptomyces indicus TaxID=417292 RepID=A0A1G8YN30_9ACTN|nr:GNAT family N-acetyltransferase [Streptomyces indicus]SDK04146.1 Acetyltransferase (GNAT) domain-containing protein [Streptomyces indicus]